ncbi:MAG: pimeloyl-ACP methyl ester carboxylesterase [Pseudohongiellaceae bacterium]|jgi:pimeloyl-ACP methyl ester carboxylesterase
MSNYILVHGAWGGAWEFADVVNLLSTDGNKVTALDLPGHGENKQPLANVTMAAYIKTVVEAVKAQDEDVILVGHSLAGAVIAQVAEEIPEHIDRLVFVAAILPANGETPLGLMQSDDQGQLLPNVIFSEDQSYGEVTEETVRTVLLNDIKDQAHLDRLVPHFLFKQSTEPFMAEAQLTDTKFGSVHKSYIRAGVDKVLTPALQDKMIQSWNVDKVFTLESGHFPLNSIPAELVKVIREAS